MDDYDDDWELEEEERGRWEEEEREKEDEERRKHDPDEEAMKGFVIMDIITRFLFGG